MFKLLFALPAVLFFALQPQDPATTPEKAIPADAAALTNPVTATAESRAHARTLYAMDCAMCHGTNGDGKGDLVADMKLTMKDFTDPAALKDMTDGQLFYIIKNGRGQMQGESGRAKDAGLWNMVILVRSFAKK